MSKNFISVVIAVKDSRIEDLRLCLASFAALKKEYEKNQHDCSHREQL